MERHGKKRTLVLLPKHEPGTTNVSSIKELCPTRHAEDSTATSCSSPQPQSLLGHRLQTFRSVMLPHFHQANLKTSIYILNSLYVINQCNLNNVVK